MLDESHPIIKENVGLITKQIGEALLRDEGYTDQRHTLAQTLGLPSDTPVRLHVHAVESRKK
ncbi:hypothetical protein [Kitasatospora sp. NPDC004531]